MTSQINIDTFLTVDIRVGRIISAEPFTGAKKPAYKLLIDFGSEIGHKKSSAQITGNYAPEDLAGKLVAGIVNLPPRQIGKFMSEVLVLGFPDELGNVTLVTPDKDVPIGGRLY
jgi:tRNA-binding protein